MAQPISLARKKSIHRGKECSASRMRVVESMPGRDQSARALEVASRHSLAIGSRASGNLQPDVTRRLARNDFDGTIERARASRGSYEGSRRSDAAPRASVSTRQDANDLDR